ncbi:SDR family NAD(P)-dependent oxidoreductase, partial [Streptomyces sp. SID11233]|nr:SDR family NAD(P)-dependent oxidoreductase [Streptomyces sp. SID11233]
MDSALNDRVVLVTGGTRGIGAAVAEAFAAEGARVALTYRNDEEAAERAAAGLGSERAMAVRYALDEPDSARAALDEVRQRWGGVDVLVANAYHRTGRRPAGQSFEQVAAAEWQATITDNLIATMALTQAVLPDMRGRRWGRVVYLSSHIVGHGRRGQETYAAVKSGLHGFARSLAWEAGKEG